jgi:hypothetical protein
MPIAQIPERLPSLRPAVALIIEEALLSPPALHQEPDRWEA